MSDPNILTAEQQEVLKALKQRYARSLPTVIIGGLAMCGLDGVIVSAGAHCFEDGFRQACAFHNLKEQIRQKELEGQSPEIE